MLLGKLLARSLPFALGALASCLSDPPTFFGRAPSGRGPTVRFDVFSQPFADIPLPNDFATRYDDTSPTKRRLNASVLAGKTTFERATREQLDALTGWGTLAPITVSFDAPIDPEVLITRHWRDNYDFGNDAVYVIDVTPGSPGHCEAIPLDVGQGNYPQVLAQPTIYDADPRAGLQTLVFEEIEEDTNGNGVLDPGEDTDMDGVLDHPNTRDGKPGSQLLEFYERETNTLILKPVMPMREATTYAVVLTNRLTSPSGAPVRSPFPGAAHASQTSALAPLPACLGRYGLARDDVAFAWTFTTQNISRDYLRVRDGLYGRGALAALATDYPATPSRVDDVRGAKPDAVNTKIVPMTTFIPLALKLLELTGASDAEKEIFNATLANVDFVVAGAIRSPQMFPRTDTKGGMLPLYRQVWGDEPARSEEVPFWMFVPKARKGPAPAALFIHGHGGSKFDALPFAGILASYGVATIGIDAPSHGVGLTSVQLSVVRSYFSDAGVSGLGDSLFRGRAFDWNGDGNVDSGDDYWSAYVFHTRDMVRQTMVDAMQVLRTLRAFDGKATWAFDPAKRGAPGIAGDFDGDGAVDVGGPTAPLHVFGGSLGGITGAVFAGVEPLVDDAVSIVPGGVLGEIGTRTTLSGVRNAMVLRMLGPIFYAQDGGLMVRANSGQTKDVALRVQDLPPLAPGDTVVLDNKRSGEYRCAVVQPSRTFRVAVSVDQGDPLELRVFHGTAAARAREGCVVPADEPYVDLTKLGYEVTLGDKTFEAGTPLVAPCDGLGMRRATPDLRRLLGLAQVALESADPMNWAPYWDESRRLTYGTNETVHTNVLLLPSIGDPGVMIANGVALARGAGFVEIGRDDPRYGKSQDQVLIDTYTIEGTVRLGRFRDSKNNPVLMDVEHFSAVIPVDDGLDVPRLDPPLRLVSRDRDGNYRGVLFPMLSPQGKHGFVSPDRTQPFDLGTYLLNIVGRYMQTSGRELSLDRCQATSACTWPTFPLQ